MTRPPFGGAGNAFPALGISAPLTPEQEQQVRAIFAEMIGEALRASGIRPPPTAADLQARQKIIDTASGMVRTLDAIAIAEGRAPRSAARPAPQEGDRVPLEDAPSVASPRAPKGVH